MDGVGVRESDERSNALSTPIAVLFARTKQPRRHRAVEFREDAPWTAAFVVLPCRRRLRLSAEEGF